MHGETEAGEGRGRAGRWQQGCLHVLCCLGSPPAGFAEVGWAVLSQHRLTPMAAKTMAKLSS